MKSSPIFGENEKYVKPPTRTNMEPKNGSDLEDDVPNRFFFQLPAVGFSEPAHSLKLPDFERVLRHPGIQKKWSKSTN